MVTDSLEREYIWYTVTYCIVRMFTRSQQIWARKSNSNLVGSHAHHTYQCPLFDMLLGGYPWNNLGVIKAFGINNMVTIIIWQRLSHCLRQKS